MEKTCRPDELVLRNLVDDDLPIFFEHQLDQEANYMAAFTAKDPTDQEAFMAHWQRILADKTVILQTILFNGQVAGSGSSFEDDGRPEVTYWLGKEYGVRALRHGRFRSSWRRRAQFARSMHGLPRTISARVGFWRNAALELSANPEALRMPVVRK